jgi:hypothetical protein
MGVRDLAALAGVGILLGIAWGGWQYRAGYSAGKAKIEAEISAATLRQKAQIFQLNTRLAEKTAALDAAQAARQSLVERLEHEAAADPDAIHRRPSADSLHRLKRRWTAQ